MSSQNSSRLIEEQVSEEESESNNDTTTASTIMNSNEEDNHNNSVEFFPVRTDQTTIVTATNEDNDNNTINVDDDVDSDFNDRFINANFADLFSYSRQFTCILRRQDAAFFEGESAVKLKKKKKDDKLSSSATKISKDKIDNSPQTSTSASNNETITSVSKNKCYGVLNDMFKINLVPNLSSKSFSSNTATTYTHRLSYNTRNNAYYENGNLDDIYIKRWERGAFKAVNMCRKEENDWKMVYLARNIIDYNEKSANIIWKFDYRPSKLVINSISLKLRSATFDETASVKWMIQLTPTRSNPNTDWILLDYSDNTNNNIYWERNDNDGRKDLTAVFNLGDDYNDVNNNNIVVKNQHGFKLRALLSGGTTHYCWQKTQLFRQALTSPNKDDPNSRNGMADDDESFGLDVKVELKPQFICELPLNNNNNAIPSYSSPLQNNTSQIKKPFILDDLSDSDFTIILDNDYDGNSNTATTSDDMATSSSMTTSIDSNAATISTSPSTSPSTSNEPSKKKSFHVHSKILTDNSEYFNALIHSPMIESQNHTLLLKDTSYQTMKTILEFLYTGELSSINKDDGNDDKGDNNMDVSPLSSSSSSKRPLLSPRATTVPTSGVEQWIDLLYVATRFLIKPLIQRCEKELGKFVNMDNANEFELIANECGADQLLTYCKTLDFKSPNYGDDDDYLYATSTSSGDETIYDTEYDDANHNDVEDEESVAYPEQYNNNNNDNNGGGDGGDGDGNNQRDTNANNASNNNTSRWNSSLSRFFKSF